MNLRPRRAWRLATILFFASGAGALIHQVVWTRRLVDVLGASGSTFSQVVSAFFAGLAMGAWWMVWRPPAPDRATTWAAWAEMFVAVLAIPPLLAIPLADALRPLVGGGMLKALLAPLLVAPPAIAMGMVLPAAIRALEPERSSGRILALYAANTLGGVAGIALAVLGLLPSLGITGTGCTGCALNLAVAAGLLTLRRRIRDEGLALGARIGGGEHRRPTLMDTDETRLTRSHFGSEPAKSDEVPDIGVHLSPSAVSTPVCRLAATSTPAFSAGQEKPMDLDGPNRLDGVIGFASGALVICMEVVLQHQFSQVAINSTFASATVLALVLLALGLASALAPLWRRLFATAPSALLAALVGAGVVSSVEPWMLIRATAGLRPLPYTLSAGMYFAQLAIVGAVTILPVLLVAGLVFPLLLGRSTSSPALARLLVWNGLGGWLGSEFMQGVVAPALGLWRSVGACALVYAALGCVLALQSRTAIGRIAASLAVLCGAVSFLSAGRLPQTMPRPGDTLVSVAVGREGVVGTVHGAPDDWRILFNNTYTLGGSLAAGNQERQAHLPIVLHGRARSVALLGVATGSTLAGATLHRALDHIEAAELSPLALSAAQQYFTPFNRNAFADPRVHITVDDARWLAAERPGRFDVVIGDLFLPWRTGEGRLFTQEHFTQVRAALRSDGLFCQWLPLYQLTRAQFDTIARTFQSVFPETLVLRGDFYADMPIVGLVGGRRLEHIDWPATDRVCALLAADSRITDPIVRHPDGVAMMLLGRLPTPAPGPINTLANNWLEWDAGRNIVGLRSLWFIGVPEAEWARGIHRATNPLLPERWRMSHDAGQFFLTLDVAVTSGSPLAANLRAQVVDRLPTALREDPKAQWQHWPSREKPVLRR